DGQRHETLLGRATHDVIKRVAPLMAGGDIEKAQLVGAFAVIEASLLDRVAGIGQVNKVDTLDDAPVLDVQAGDHPHLQHRPPSATMFSAAAGSTRPSYNARPQMMPAIPSASCAFSAVMSSRLATPPEAISGSPIRRARAPIAGASTPIKAP